MSFANKLTIKNVAVAAAAGAGLFVLYRIATGKCPLPSCCGSCCSSNKTSTTSATTTTTNKASSPSSINTTTSSGTTSIYDEDGNTPFSPSKNPNPVAVTISGPAGAGKGTMIHMLQEKYPGLFGFSVSHTSRAARAGEVNGTHYHFSSKEEMLKMDEHGEFVELCPVHTNLYGTSFRSLKNVTDSGKAVIIEVDVKGSQKIKNALVKHNPFGLHMSYIFIRPPNFEELEKRMVARGSEDAEKIKVRLETARNEMAFVTQQPEHFDFILTNDTKEEAFARLEKFLLEKGAISKLAVEAIYKNEK